MRSGAWSLLRCGATSSRTAAGVGSYSLTLGKRASCAQGVTDATSRERLGKRPVNCGGRGRVPSPASHRPLTGLSPDRGVPLPDRVVAGPAQGVPNGGAGVTSARAAGSRFVFLPHSKDAAMPRIAGRNFLFVPGPTNVPERILRAMHRAMEDHRSSAFPELTLPLFQDLKKIFKTTTGQVFVFPGTGTGGWETALTNTLSPGDRVLAPRFGQFSHLWIDLAQRIGLRVDILDVEWGEGAPVERIEEILTADRQHEIKGVLIVHNETATGVTSERAGVRPAPDPAGHPGLLYVDGVSSIASIDFRMDEWQVDVAGTGSQKGVMLPPGLAVGCARPQAPPPRGRGEGARGHFRFGDMVQAQPSRYLPPTPAVPMLYGLREAVNVLLDEGLDGGFARHHRLPERGRSAGEAWGPRLFAQGPQRDSGTGSAVPGAPGVKRAGVVDRALP